MNSVIATSSSSGYREQIDTTGPFGRAVVVIASAIAGLERTLIVERVCAGLHARQQDLTISYPAKQYGIAETRVRRRLLQFESTPPETSSSKPLASH
jgi:DNA invertase Pin-like site-specific DNA recombinase